MDIYTLETDGSYNDALDYCGIGGVLYKNGQLIDFYSLTSKIEPMHHESLSLLYGVLLAKKHGAQHLVVKTDSRSHAEYFNNENKRTQERIELDIKTQHLLKSLTHFKFLFYKRTNNRTADALSTLYQNNGGKSSTIPIDVSEVLPSDAFMNNQHEIDFQSKTLRLRTAICNVSENTNFDKTEQTSLFFNLIRYNTQTNQLEHFSQPVEDNLQQITQLMHNQVLEEKKTRLIFNGQYAQLIREALATCHHMGKHLNASFIALSPYWEQLAKGENIELFEGFNHKGKIFASTQNVSMPEPLRNPNQKEAHYVSIQIRAKKDTHKDQNGELIHTHYLIYESCDINILTEEKTYQKKRLKHNLAHVIAELQTTLSQSEKYYQFDIQGVYAPVIHTYFTTGQSSNSTRHVLKKLDSLRAEAHFEQDGKWNKITNSFIAREASKAILLHQQKKKQKKSKIALSQSEVVIQPLEAQSHIEKPIAKESTLSIQFFSEIAKKHIKLFEAHTLALKKRFRM